MGEWVACVSAFPGQLECCRFSFDAVQEAIAARRRALQLNPLSALAARGLAQALVADGRRSEAAAVLQLSLSGLASPDEAAAQTLSLELAGLRFLDGDGDSAARMYK